MGLRKNCRAKPAPARDETTTLLTAAIEATIAPVALLLNRRQLVPGR